MTQKKLISITIIIRTFIRVRIGIGGIRGRALRGRQTERAERKSEKKRRQEQSVIATVLV